MALAFIIGVPTAIFPIGFSASPAVERELSFNPDMKIHETTYQRCRKPICIPTNRDAEEDASWFVAFPTPNWTIEFHSNEIIYGTEYWVNYEPQGLLEYLRERSEHYELHYKRDDILVFTLQVNKFYESGQWYVRITTVYHNINLNLQDSHLILQDLPYIFNTHEQCSVCWDNAFLVEWGTCTHSFCDDCVERWRQQGNHTCPLCRALVPI